MSPNHYLLVSAVIGLNRRQGAIVNCQRSVPSPINALSAINMRPSCSILSFLVQLASRCISFALA